MLIDSKGQLKIGDFGVAQYMVNGVVTGNEGTVMYMAPEVSTVLFVSVLLPSTLHRFDSINTSARFYFITSG